jgi:hypothetical protein
MTALRATVVVVTPSPLALPTARRMAATRETTETRVELSVTM